MRFINFIFIFQFLHGVLHPSLTGDLSSVRYVWDVFHVLLGHTFVFCLCTNNLKNLKKDLQFVASNICKINLFGDLDAIVVLRFQLVQFKYVLK